jgi:acetolactate synthase-1/3 small subunit
MKKDHILLIKAQNHYGVLAKVTNLLRRRMFNIEGMTAGYTEEKGISHITVYLSSQIATEVNLEQAKKQLSKIIEVISVKEVNKSTVREMAIFKLHASEKTKPPILDAVKLFEGKIIGVDKKCIIVEVTGTPGRIDDFHDLVKNYGIKEFVRSSVIALKA